MALITTPIGKQNFELIRDQIGAILLLELAEQKLLGSDLPDIKGFSERIVAVDKTQMPCFNVLFSGGDYERKTRRSKHGVYTYYVDVYSNAKGTEDDSADLIAAVQMQRILGLCGAILDDAKYETLGFAASFGIESSVVNAINVMDKGNGDDAISSTVGRLTLVVKVPETFTVSAGVDCLISTGTVKLDSTELGYQYSFASS